MMMTMMMMMMMMIMIIIILKVVYFEKWFYWPAILYALFFVFIVKACSRQIVEWCCLKFFLVSNFYQP